jgi:hypothetical protein
MISVLAIRRSTSAARKQKLMLGKLDCDAIQSHSICRPLNAADFQEWLMRPAATDGTTLDSLGPYELPYCLSQFGEPATAPAP